MWGFLRADWLSEFLETSRDLKQAQHSDLREFGMLENDADVVSFACREDFHPEDEDPEKKNAADLIIAKRRNDLTDKVRHHFDCSSF